MIGRWLNAYCRALEMLLFLSLAVMVVLVFGNVVLRYAFNLGITVSEEVSRWLFVWMTFLGAVVALHRRGHLGTEVLISRLGRRGQKACAVLSQGLMLFVTWLLLKGAWQQMLINADVAAPVTGAPVALVYAAGVVFAVSAAVLLAVDLVRLLAGQPTGEERESPAGRSAS